MIQQKAFVLVLEALRRRGLKSRQCRLTNSLRKWFLSTVVCQVPFWVPLDSIQTNKAPWLQEFLVSLGQDRRQLSMVTVSGRAETKK